MQNQIGVVSCHMQFESIREAFEMVGGYGLDSIEWFETGDLRYSDPRTAGEIRELSRRFGIGASYHAFYYGEWDLGLQERDAALSVMKRKIESAAQLGAHLLTIHLGRYDPETGRDAAMRNVVDAIAAAAETAERRNVVITVENFTLCHGENFLGDRTADFEVLFEAAESDAVGLNLDVGHANVTGNLDELLDRFGHRLRNTHLHDTDGVTDGHLPPGDGTVDWDSLLAAFRRIGYEGPFNFEFPEASGKYPEIIAMIRNS